MQWPLLHWWKEIVLPYKGRWSLTKFFFCKTFSYSIIYKYFMLLPLGVLLEHAFYPKIQDEQKNLEWYWTQVEEISLPLPRHGSLVSVKQLQYQYSPMHSTIITKWLSDANNTKSTLTLPSIGITGWRVIVEHAFEGGHDDEGGPLGALIPLTNSGSW